MGGVVRRLLPYGDLNLAVPGDFEIIDETGATQVGLCFSRIHSPRNTQGRKCSLHLRFTGVMQCCLSTARAALQEIETGCLDANRQLQRLEAQTVSQESFPQGDTVIPYLHNFVAVGANDMK